MVTGVALLNKYNVVFLVAALAVGVVATGRGRLLRGRWPALGAALALLIVAPNVIWNAAHGWPAIAMLRSLHAENSTLGASIGFAPAQLLFVGPFLAPLWLGGLATLWRDARARVFPVAYGTLVVAYVLTGAKPYYLAGIYFVLLAAGGVWVDRWIAARARRHARDVAIWLVAGAVLGAALTLPVLPVAALPRSSWESKINKDLSATVGWPQFVRQVVAVRSRLPASARPGLVVLTGDYGAAGAIDEFGARYGLPHAISGHNNYWLWGPGAARNGATTIAVNLPRSLLTRLFATVRSAGTVHTPHDVWTEERGAPIWICQYQRVTWAAAWSDLRHYG